MSEHTQQNKTTIQYPAGPDRKRQSVSDFPQRFDSQSGVSQGLDNQSASGAPQGLENQSVSDAPRKSDRQSGPDTLRGLALCSMLLYHACWDLVWIFGVNWPWYRSNSAYLWQQSICWTFILLSGYCARLGRHLFRRGLIVFACGWGITAVTALFMPSNLVFCGVLTFLGGAMLLTVPLERFFRRLPVRTACVTAFILFLLVRNIPSGAFGFEHAVQYTTAAASLPRLPSALYRNALTACLGFPYPGFFSTDYFPLLPWIFLFWTGYFLYDLRPEISAPYPKIPVLAWLGRHSLWIYLAHQPVIYMFLLFWNAFLRGGQGV